MPGSEVCTNCMTVIFIIFFLIDFPRKSRCLSYAGGDFHLHTLTDFLTEASTGTVNAAGLPCPVCRAPIAQVSWRKDPCCIDIEDQYDQYEHSSCNIQWDHRWPILSRLWKGGGLWQTRRARERERERKKVVVVAIIVLICRCTSSSSRRSNGVEVGVGVGVSNRSRR